MSIQVLELIKNHMFEIFNKSLLTDEEILELLRKNNLENTNIQNWKVSMVLNPNTNILTIVLYNIVEQKVIEEKYAL